ncbi:hypothetical protein HY416_00385 [Candidatus Kaiserbacteria bacterium]|nr:hypothetical protein [Candidatus Kaiserbacteria bacterium]
MGAQTHTVPVVENDDITRGIAKDEPSYFLEKKEWAVLKVIGRVREALET